MPRLMPIGTVMPGTLASSALTYSCGVLSDAAPQYFLARASRGLLLANSSEKSRARWVQCDRSALKTHTAGLCQRT